jgi:replicative DNA helicase
MSLDVEHLLNCRILQDKEILKVTEAGIKPEFFLDPENLRVFQRIAEFTREHGSVPTIRVMKADFPTYKFNHVDEPMSFLLEEMRKNRAMALLQVGLENAVTTYDTRDPVATKQVLTEMLSLMANEIVETRDVDITKTVEERIDRYKDYRDNPNSMLGYPTGFRTIDRATKGLQSENLVTIVGPPKAGKSTVMELVAKSVWQQGKTVLFFTFEMSNDEMSERLDAFMAKVSHDRLQSGTLKKTEWDNLTSTLHSVESMPSFYFSADTNGASTLSGIAAKIDALKPDIVFIDGVYMLHDEISGEVNSQKALTNLTRGFKRMAQNKQIPVVISSQVLEWKMDKKKGITSSSIGYSSSFSQDSNTILGIEKTEDKTIQKLKVVLARNCPPLEVYVMWDWDTGTFQELEYDPFGEESTSGTGAGGGWGADHSTPF